MSDIYGIYINWAKVIEKNCKSPASDTHYTDRKTYYSNNTKIPADIAVHFYSMWICFYLFYYKIEQYKTFFLQ